MWCDHSSRARHPGMWSQVGLSITMNKASRGDGIPVELFQILKDDAVKVLHSICQQIWKTQHWPQGIALISHAKSNAQNSPSQVSNTWTINFQMFKLVLEKAEEPEIKLPKSTGSLKKQESSRKTSISAYWLCQSLWLCGSQQTEDNSSKDGNTRPPYLSPEKSVFM